MEDSLGGRDERATDRYHRANDSTRFCLVREECDRECHRNVDRTRSFVTLETRAANLNRKETEHGFGCAAHT